MEDWTWWEGDKCSKDARAIYKLIDPCYICPLKISQENHCTTCGREGPCCRKGMYRLIYYFLSIFNFGVTYANLIIKSSWSLKILGFGITGFTPRAQEIVRGKLPVTLGSQLFCGAYITEHLNHALQPFRLYLLLKQTARDVVLLLLWCFQFQVHLILFTDALGLHR